MNFIKDTSLAKSPSLPSSRYFSGKILQDKFVYCYCLMNTGEALYHQITDALPDTIKGRMFGALCAKTPQKKAFVMYWKTCMIFKLEGKADEEARALKGAKTFEPAPGRPMNGWVQLSADHQEKWKYFAEKARNMLLH